MADHTIAIEKLGQAVHIMARQVHSLRTTAADGEERRFNLNEADELERNINAVVRTMVELGGHVDIAAIKTIIDGKPVPWAVKGD